MTMSVEERLATLEERQRNISDGLQDIKRAVEELDRDTTDGFKAFDDKLIQFYVTLEAFNPVRTIVFGLVAIILTAVIGAVVGLVVVQP